MHSEPDVDLDQLIGMAYLFLGSFIGLSDLDSFQFQFGGQRLSVSELPSTHAHCAPLILIIHFAIVENRSKE